MSIWKVDTDNLDKLFVVWAFLFQIVLIAHYAARKPFFESYTVKYGWIVYALCIPAAIISVLLLLDGSLVVVLEPDIAQVFHTPDAVKKVLRALIATMPPVSTQPERD